MTNQSAPNITPDPIPTRKHDLFEDPALAKSIQEDPVAKFIVSHWKNAVVVILAVIGFFYLQNQIRSTTDVRVSESSQTFDSARNALAKLADTQTLVEGETSTDGEPKKENVEGSQSTTPASDPAKKIENEKLIRSLRDSLVALKSGPEPYSFIAPLYEKALSDIEKSSALGAALTTQQSSTEENAPQSWAKTTDPGQRLVLELQEFASIRGMLDSDLALQEGLSNLKKLAQEGAYLRAPAILALLRVAATPEDKSAAVSIAQDVMRVYPEQASKIEAELKRLM